MKKRNLDREIETCEIFKSMFQYLGKTRYQRPQERVNITSDASGLIDQLSSLRNVLVIPPQSREEIRDFVFYSFSMLEHFSFGALRDWIVREYLETSVYASGPVRDVAYNRLRYHLFPKSKKPSSKMKMLLPFYAEKYDSLIMNIKKTLKGREDPDNSILTLKEKFPEYLPAIEHFQHRIKSCLIEKDFSTLTHIFLCSLFNVSYNSGPKVLTQSRKINNKNKL